MNRPSNATPPKPGDVQNGHVLTDNGQWVPTNAVPERFRLSTLPMAPPKNKHTVGNVILIVLTLGVIGVGAGTALVVGGLGAAGKAIEQDANKAGGTDNPLEIEQGKAFEVDGFDYSQGWSLGTDPLGDMTVKGLKVTNNRDDKDSAIVEIKVWNGTEVLALADCTTDPIDAGTTVSVNCYSMDKPPKNFDNITINDTF